NLRVTGIGLRDKPTLAPGAATGTAGVNGASARALVHLAGGAEAIDAPVYAREALVPGAELTGPALIEEYASTTVLFTRDRATVASSLELIIDIDAGAPGHERRDA
ncbi:MAG: hypothetical protein WAU75_20010, partial [Solirubrobacteraceae bacterium]